MGEFLDFCMTPHNLYDKFVTIIINYKIHINLVSLSPKWFPLKFILMGSWTDDEFYMVIDVLEMEWKKPKEVLIYTYKFPLGITSIDKKWRVSKYFLF